MKRSEEMTIEKEDRLLGIRHVTTMTSGAEKGYHSFTGVLGMHLVEKTVSQDNIYIYRTYFANDLGIPGTTMTLFGFPNSPKGLRGANIISGTGFRVLSDAALACYENHFNELAVGHTDAFEEFGKKILRLWDFDGQAYQLISDELNQSVATNTPWRKEPIPTEFTIYGLGPVEMTTSYLHEFKEVFEEILGFYVVVQEGNRYLLEVRQGDSSTQVVLADNNTSSQAQQGYDEAHRVTFRLTDRKSLGTWQTLFDHLGLRNSGHIDRYYSESLYVHIEHVLVGLATDEPGFMESGSYGTLGEKLPLVPFLKNRREYIKSVIKSFNIKRT